MGRFPGLPLTEVVQLDETDCTEASDFYSGGLEAGKGPSYPDQLTTRTTCLPLVMETARKIYKNLQ